MATVPLTAALRGEYEQFFAGCTISAAHQAEVEGIVNRLLANKNRYQKVSGKIGVPWHFVAVVHYLEASLSFTKHLHNGDPLTARTVRVPAGRPATGSPPFSWEESAEDALILKNLHRWTDWTVAGTLYQLERYNGFGYRLHHPTVKSPYLWSYSNRYTRGKYVTDGRWDPNAVSRQCGAATLLRRLADRGAIQLGGAPPADAEREAIPQMTMGLAAGEPEAETGLTVTVPIRITVSVDQADQPVRDLAAARETEDKTRSISDFIAPENPRLDEAGAGDAAALAPQ
jgi:lysozyme family protein